MSVDLAFWSFLISEGDMVRVITLILPFFSAVPMASGVSKERSSTLSFFTFTWPW